MNENLQERQDEYTMYLLSEQRGPSATKAWKAYDDRTRYSFQYFLENSNVTPQSLFEEIKNNLCLNGWTLSIDDSVEDKHFSIIWKAHFVDKFWSGRHKRVAIGIDLLTLFYTDTHGVKLPVNYRIIDKTENKTKNEYFMEMVEEVLNWWLKPRMATGDSWFASEDNMKFFIKRKIGFLFALKSNRLASDETKTYKHVSEYSLGEEGVILHLKNVWFVRIFEKNTFFYAYHDGNSENKRDRSGLEDITRKDFEGTHSKHWHIEEYHRAIKQVCNTEKHFFRNKNTITSHIHCSLRAFCVLEVSRVRWILKNWYSFATESMARFVRQTLQKTHIKDMGLVFG